MEWGGKPSLPTFPFSAALGSCSGEQSKHSRAQRGQCSGAAWWPRRWHSAGGHGAVTKDLAWEQRTWHSSRGCGMVMRDMAQQRGTCHSVEGHGTSPGDVAQWRGMMPSLGAQSPAPRAHPSPAGQESIPTPALQRPPMARLQKLPQNSIPTPTPPSPRSQLLHADASSRAELAPHVIAHLRCPPCRAHAATQPRPARGAPMGAPWHRHRGAGRELPGLAQTPEMSSGFALCSHSRSAQWAK